jgi:hypothetical protein
LWLTNYHVGIIFHVDMIGELISRFTTSHAEDSVRCPTYSQLKGEISEAQYKRALRDLDARYAYHPFPSPTKTASR